MPVSSARIVVSVATVLALKLANIETKPVSRLYSFVRRPRSPRPRRFWTKLALSPRRRKPWESRAANFCRFVRNVIFVDFRMIYPGERSLCSLSIHRRKYMSRTDAGVTLSLWTALSRSPLLSRATGLVFLSFCAERIVRYPEE